jgi:hypothetical protein
VRARCVWRQVVECEQELGKGRVKLSKQVVKKVKGLKLKAKDDKPQPPAPQVGVHPQAWQGPAVLPVLANRHIIRDGCQLSHLLISRQSLWSSPCPLGTRRAHQFAQGLPIVPPVPPSTPHVTHAVAKR